MMLIPLAELTTSFHNTASQGEGSDLGNGKDSKWNFWNIISFIYYPVRWGFRSLFLGHLDIICDETWNKWRVREYCILPLLFSVTFGGSRAARKLAGDDSLGELKLELALLQPSSIMEMEAARSRAQTILHYWCGRVVSVAQGAITRGPGVRTAAKVQCNMGPNCTK